MDAAKAASRILFVLVLLIHGSIQKSDPASPTYRAGVVEFRPIEYTNDSAKTLDENSELIISHIEQAAAKEVDILVFPEMALPSISLGRRQDLVARSTLVPHPSQNYAPCNNSRILIQEAVKKIACAVEKNGIYVVINLLEQEVCSGTDCPSDGLFVYISNVVFDRNGRIIARTRKNHLTDEYTIVNVVEKPEPSFFDTDFGVTFGSMICFDFIHEELWTEFKSHNITDVVFASGWYSIIPFLATIPLQAGVAYARDVNFLSSGYNRKEWGYSGSGIYAGRQGIITALMASKDCNELLVADVLKKTISTTQMDRRSSQNSTADQGEHVHDELPENYYNNRFVDWPNLPFEDFETKLISENSFTVERLSHGEIECEFRVNITNLDPSQGRTYRLVAFDGIFPIAKTRSRFGVGICAIVLCANDTIAVGRDALTSSGTFNSIEIEAVHADNPKRFIMPNTLRTNMMPLTNWTWDQHKRENSVHTLMSLTTSAENVITFGMFGRNYERDFRVPALH